MKILRYMLISIGLILVIAFAVLYFSPDHFSISNSIEINKPAGCGLYGSLPIFKKWEAWDPYMEKEPNAKMTYEGAPASVGEKMSWDGQKVGMGSMTLASATPNQTLDMNLDFLVKPMKNTGKDNWKIETMGDKTKVGLDQQAVTLISLWAACLILCSIKW